MARFPRKQNAIRQAATVADATIFTDNGRDEKRAFTVCRVQLGEAILFDRRAAEGATSPVIGEWLAKVSPLTAP